MTQVCLAETRSQFSQQLPQADTICRQTTGNYQVKITRTCSTTDFGLNSEIRALNMVALSPQMSHDPRMECGIPFYRPKYLQVLNTMKSFMGFYTALLIAYGELNGFPTANLSIKKRFLTKIFECEFLVFSKKQILKKTFFIT